MFFVCAIFLRARSTALIFLFRRAPAVVLEVGSCALDINVVPPTCEESAALALPSSSLDLCVVLDRLDFLGQHISVDAGAAALQQLELGLRLERKVLDLAVYKDFNNPFLRFTARGGKNVKLTVLSCADSGAFAQSVIQAQLAKFKHLKPLVLGKPCAF